MQTKNTNTSSPTEPSTPQCTPKQWDLFWSPEGRKIGRVTASTAKAAKRKADLPYRKYLGEIYAVEVA
jgi:hypothetical protein